MKFYVATASANIGAAEGLVRFIKSQGHEITHDWCPMVREYGRGAVGKVPPETMRHAAVMDAWGAETCDVFILLDHPELYGALIELGMHLGARTPQSRDEVWIVPAETSYSIFFELPRTKLMSLEKVLKQIEGS